MGQHDAAEGQQGDGSHRTGQQGHAQGFADTDDVDADDHHEQADAQRPATEAGQRFHVGGKEVGDCPGADGQRQGAGGANQIAGEGSEGQLRIGENATGVRLRGGQFGDTQRQPTAEHGHQQQGQQHVGPAIACQAVVPAGELAGDDQRNAEPGDLGPAENALFEHGVYPLSSNGWSRRNGLSRVDRAGMDKGDGRHGPAAWSVNA
ncbi:hypothetical protein D9M71_312780 [compost metagenome]